MKEKRYMNLQKHRRVIISGGGTGGHVYPAISIANALRKLDPSVEILFVGAEGRMEMEKVPAAGYKIVGLPVTGINRGHIIRNITVLFKLLKSLRMARKAIKEFKPDVVACRRLCKRSFLKFLHNGNSTLIQEQTAMQADK
jgi:UDP-N-acetylglucosamine--N-acetylmuramyl-(pentapeptide) pyrophosphoryl-undecaprenol N-acetylglucosamine transferase